MKRENKQQIVVELHERAQRATFAVLTDFRGLSVSAMSELRKNLREVDVEYQVVKNTLLERASEGTDLAILKDEFKGPCAVALAYGDPVEPAKVLDQFAKANEKFEIKVGVLSGKLVDAAGIKTLSSMPSREQLLGQLLATMNAVPTGFVRVLAEVPRSMLNVLNAIKDQKEAA